MLLEQGNTYFMVLVTRNIFLYFDHKILTNVYSKDLNIQNILIYFQLPTIAQYYRKLLCTTGYKSIHFI